MNFNLTIDANESIELKIKEVAKAAFKAGQDSMRRNAA